jgi:UDP-glucose:(heptosyl)LPS alpha-1,3-glucosyltransferase
MHIALIRQRYSSLGGAENTLAHLAQEFIRQGHEVTILAASWQDAAQLIPVQGLHWRQVPVKGGKVARTLGFALNTRKILRREKFDLIYSLERTLYQDVYRAGDGCHREWLARRRPFAGSLERLGRRLNPFHLVMLALEKQLLQSERLSLVIANSRQVRAELMAHYQVPAEKIRVIYNGVDHVRFLPSINPTIREQVCLELGLVGSPPLILFVGSGFRRKGLAFLIAALPRLRNPRSQLLVIGQGKIGPYRRQAQKLGVADRIRFLGPQTDVEKYYHSADVMALPTIYDPCSNVVLEALACGKPVITTSGNGAGEFIRPGENGDIIAQPDDLDGLGQALENFLERRKDSRICAAAVHAVAGLSWQRNVRETLAALTAIGQ